jgi:hypothetical protein
VPGLGSGNSLEFLESRKVTNLHISEAHIIQKAEFVCEASSILQAVKDIATKGVMRK